MLSAWKTEEFEVLNKSLTAIDETPIKTKCLIKKKYPEAKILKVTEAFRIKIFNLNQKTSDSETEKNYDKEIISQF